MYTKRCKKCGAKNPLKAVFCQECGEKFIKGENPLSRAASSWDKRNNGFKIFTGLGGLFVFFFLLVLIFALIFPVTGLDIENTTVNIDNQTTEYLLKGKTEANATVTISSKALNLTEVEAQVGEDGNFEYRVHIPVEVTELDVNVSAKATNKTRNNDSVKITRPITPLYVAEPSNIKFDAESVNITGKTDPNTEIAITSTDLNITNVKVTSDATGNFNSSINISKEKNNVKFLITAKANGKRSNNKTIDVSREPEPAPTTNTSTSVSTAPSSTSNTVTSTSSSNSASTPSSSPSSSSSTTYSGTSSNSGSGSYIANSNTGKFHISSCYYVGRMNEEHKVRYNSRAAAINAGYDPCQKCNP